MSNKIKSAKEAAKILEQLNKTMVITSSEEGEGHALIIDSMDRRWAITRAKLPTQEQDQLIAKEWVWLNDMIEGFANTTTLCFQAALNKLYYLHFESQLIKGECYLAALDNITVISILDKPAEERERLLAVEYNRVNYIAKEFAIANTMKY